MKVNRKLIFIQSTYGDAHQMIRFKELKSYYTEYELLAFDREYYNTTDNLNYTSLGKISHGKYFNRVFNYLNSIKIIKSKMSTRLENDIYFYGFDLLSVISLFNRFIGARLIFEIADIREVYFEESIKSYFMTTILNKSMLKVDAVVVTSNYYVDFLTGEKKTQIKNSFLLENKVYLDEIKLTDESLDQRIIIGYFGLLRCNRSLKILLELVESSEKFKVVIHGYFLNVFEELIEKCENHPNIEVNGEYKSPQDLKKMYGQIDLSWTAYPYSNKKVGNFNLARTNRFYEAGFFCKPMIGSINTGDSQFIRDKSLGIIINLGNIKESVEIIEKINRKDIDKWKSNILKCGIDSFKASPKDYEELLKYLQ